MEYSIYTITSPSGKVYVGQSKNVDNRLLNYKWTGKQTKRQPILHKSLIKYGFIQHKVEIISTGLTKEEANSKEREHIKIYKDIGKSLNCTNGGADVSDRIRTPIVQFDLNGKFIKEFDSIIDGANEIKIIPQKIQICLSKKRYYSSGFLWLYKKDYDLGIIPVWNSKKSSRKKVIEQRDRNNKLINEFLGTSEAENKTGVKKQGILNCLMGSSKSAGNYKWNYKLLQ